MTSPDDLSPASVLSTSPAALPLGVTWEDLAGGLPGLVSTGTATTSHVKRGQHQGGQPSTIMTLSYLGEAGRSREQTVFFKQNPPDSREGGAYRYLAPVGMSVPPLVLRLARGDNEVLGLEFLPSIGLHPSDVDDLLDLMATLNALTDVPAEIAMIRCGMPQTEFEQTLDVAIEEVKDRWPEHHPTRWVELYRQAVGVHRALPRALTHGQLAAQQVGRTRDGGLVIFDWATLGERARLTDVANILDDLARLSDQDERAVLTRYLRHLRRAGGGSLSDEEAWAELQLTRFVLELEALPWRVGLKDRADLHRHVVAIAAAYPGVVRQLAA